METLEKKAPLREWREDAGLTCGELAELAGCSAGTVSHIETGLSRPSTPAAHRIAEVLGISVGQILAGKPRIELDVSYAAIDGFAPDAPRMPLTWWREKHSLSMKELSTLSGVGVSTISSIENGRPASVLYITRRRLADALRVAPDKLVLPGDAPVAREVRSALDYAREQLSAKERVLRKTYDFIRDDANISFRGDALDKRDALLPEIQRELKGT